MPIPSTPRDVDRVSAQQQIYNTLKDWIVDGTLVPGEFINDSEIAKYFSVSRTPVREAILLLSQQDFVKIMPSKGTKVTETSEEAAAFIYEAISCLSAEIARLAVRKQKPGDIDELKRLNVRFAFIMEAHNYSSILEPYTNFHNYILKMADNPYMESCWRQILPHAHRYELLYFKSGINKEQSVADHDDIIRAIADKSEGEAARFSQQNWIGFFNERLRPQLIEAGAKKS